jgi:hypothetical protein
MKKRGARKKDARKERMTEMLGLGSSALMCAAHDG